MRFAESVKNRLHAQRPHCVQTLSRQIEGMQKSSMISNGRLIPGRVNFGLPPQLSSIQNGLLKRA